MQDVAQDSFAFNLIRESRLQHFRQTGLDEETKQKMRVTEDSVNLRLRKDIDASADKTLVGAGHFVKAVRDGIVRHKAAPRRERNIPDLPSRASQTTFPRRSRTICREWNLPPSLTYRDSLIAALPLRIFPSPSLTSFCTLINAISEYLLL